MLGALLFGPLHHFSNRSERRRLGWFNRCGWVGGVGVSGGGGPGHPGLGFEVGLPSGVLFEPVVVSAQAGEVVVGGGPGG